MVSVNANYFIQNQPSLANELLNTLKSSVKNIMAEEEARSNFMNIQSQLIILTREAHNINAEVETIRDFIDNYYINDVVQDEIILNKYSHMIDKVSDKVENILDKSEASDMPEGMKTSLVNAYDELYSTVVNTNFSISQKITQAYLASKSNTSILQEA